MDFSGDVEGCGDMEAVGDWEATGEVEAAGDWEAAGDFDGSKYLVFISLAFLMIAGRRVPHKP